MNLSNCDLIVDHIYRGSRNKNASDDPLPLLMGVDNSAGFRHLGKRPSLSTLKLLVLKSSLKNPDWPDVLDQESGLFTYYGDNKKPGRELHDTPRKGNAILRNLFQARHDLSHTDHIPPIFVFVSAGTYRDVRFLGLAVPGSSSLDQNDDLVAIWRTAGDDHERFQNYKSIFTILDVPVIRREWIKDVQSGNAKDSAHAPAEWLDWLLYRKYHTLTAPKSVEVRNQAQQLPASISDCSILKLVYETYEDNPFEFEKCAVEIAKLMMPDIISCDLTRPWRDGGRDATGLYHIGKGDSSIAVEFALEAKCYNIKSGVGVKGTSRLVSRLRHRQFGVLVTTSYLASSAYKELKEDEHPVVVITGVDIVTLLKERIGDIQQIKKWLDRI